MLPRLLRDSASLFFKAIKMENCPIEFYGYLYMTLFWAHSALLDSRLLLLLARLINEKRKELLFDTTI